MKKKFFGGMAVLALASAVAVNVSLNVKGNLSSFSLENIEALAGESNTTKWFSNLNWTECEIAKVNGAVAFYYKGILIPAYGEYKIYGNKKVCERELTTNSCNTNDQTPCEERNS